MRGPRPARAASLPCRTSDCSDGVEEKWQVFRPTSGEPWTAPTRGSTSTEPSQNSTALRTAPEQNSTRELNRPQKSPRTVPHQRTTAPEQRRTELLLLSFASANRETTRHYSGPMLSGKRKNDGRGDAWVVVWVSLESGGRGDVCEVGFVGVKVVAVWWSCSGRCWWWRFGGGVVFDPK